MSLHATFNTRMYSSVPADVCRTSTPLLGLKRIVAATPIRPGPGAKQRTLITVSRLSFGVNALDGHSAEAGVGSELSVVYRTTEPVAYCKWVMHS